VGAREVDDHLLGLVTNLLLDGGEGAEQEVAGVIHDGGAARGDLVVSLELIEFAERMIDVGRGAKFLDVADASHLINAVP
jgi:hypothetical protein